MSDLPSFIDTPATAKMQTNNLCLNNPPLRWHADKTVPCLGEVWVFGSNLAGRHGAGAAAVARKKFGAVYGLGVGYQGLESAHCYAIPTKGEQLQTLPLDAILYAVDEFLDFAHRMERFHFFVTRIGCGLAGHRDEDIAPMFVRAPMNRCSFPVNWMEIMGNKARNPSGVRGFDGFSHA